MSKATIKNSKRLSWLLRHGIKEAGIPMDAAGWVDAADVLDALDLSHKQLLDAVATNDKGRLQLAGDRLRACQGHSRANMPVTRDALEASWRTFQPETQDQGSLWHGTGVGAIRGIAAQGIQPGERTHVHLAPRPDSHVGKRASVELLLEVSLDRLANVGISIFEAPNGVVLVRHVPLDCIIDVTAKTTARGAVLVAARHDLGLDQRPCRRSP